MAMCRFEIIRERDTYHPGDIIEGKVRYDAYDVDRVEEIIIKLLWYTTGKGVSDTYVIDEFRASRTDQSGEITFSFELPDAPWSFEGQLIQLHWAIEVIILPENHSCTFSFVMSPDGEKRNLLSIVDRVAQDLSSF